MIKGEINVEAIYRQREANQRFWRRQRELGKREAWRWMMQAKDEADRQRVRELYGVEIGWINEDNEKDSVDKDETSMIR